MLETKCQENARAIAQQIKSSSDSDVTVTQILTSGTKIGTIAVGDTTTDLYCETVPTPETPISVESDGEKTNAQLLNTLYSMIDASKINENSIFTYTVGTAKYVFKIAQIESGSVYDFVNSRLTTTATIVEQIHLASSSEATISNNGTITNNSSNVPSSGRVYQIMY